MRGKGSRCRPSPEQLRITPACAGKRPSAGSRIGYDRDHPRVCGEKKMHKISTNEIKGSPPRVRGKGLPLPIGQRRKGITPACAGKSSASDTGSQIMIGSPPRVRGKVLAKVCIGVYLRITPACAGKSSLSRTPPTPRKDHPRVCGEKAPPLSLLVRDVGSPPRVRGKELRRLP